MNKHLKLSIIAIIPMIALLVSACSKKEEANVQLNQMPQQQQAAAEPTGGNMAPGFSLANLDGETKTLTDYKGKVVMVNFWATWCGPCKREIPDFIDLQKEYGEDGLEIVGIALDDPNDVKSYVNASDINYDILIGTDQTARDYGNIRSIPTTFLVDRDGQIVASYVGLRPKEHWVEKIQGLL